MDWFQSFIDWTKEKINSPLYITFVVAVILWNWKSFYVLFWLNTENFPGISQLNYSLLVSRHVSHTHIYQIDWSLNHLWFFLVPTLATFFVIWYLPKVHNLAHKRYLEFRFDRELEFDRQNSLYQKARKNETSIQLETIKDIADKTEKIAIIESKIPKANKPESWKIEYDSNHDLRLSLEELADVIYKKKGSFKDDWGTTVVPAALPMWDLGGLVNYDGGNAISLTEKGRYFLGHLLNDKMSQ